MRTSALPRRLFALFGLCASLCQVSAASAEDRPAPRKADKPQAAAPSAADVKRADALFKQAVTLKKQSKTADACRLFEQSQALDPNGATLVNLAECHEAEGKTGTAWRELQEAYKLAKETENQEIITWTRSHIHAIVPKLFQLTVLIPAETRDTPGVTVHLDGEPLNVQVPSQFRVLDPGKHTITASAPARPDFRQEVVFAPALRKRTVMVTLEAPPPPPPNNDAAIALLIIGGAGLAGGAALFGVGMASGVDGGFLGAAAGACVVGLGTFVPGAVLLANNSSPNASGSLAPSSRHPDSLSAPRLVAVPLLSPTTAGVALTGSF